MDHESISSLANSTLPYFSLSWVDISLLILPSLTGFELASSTNILVRSLMCHNPCLRCTSTYQAARTVHHLDTPNLHPNLIQRHQWPSDDKRSQTAGLKFSDPVITKYMKRPCSNSGPLLGSPTLSFHVHLQPLAMHRHFRHS